MITGRISARFPEGFPAARGASGKLGFITRFNGLSQRVFR